MIEANKVEWPLAGAAPFSWDYMVWLVDAQMTRVRLGAPAPLQVAFTYADMMKNDYQRLFFKNVMRPLLSVVGAIESTEPTGRHKGLYITSDLCAYARAGEKFPSINASKEARNFMTKWLGQDRSPITITLRNCEHLRWRNSNVPAWMHFAEDLERKGERVIFVCDTANMYAPIGRFRTCPHASAFVDLRLALYEQARCNMFVSNGPGTLAIFGNRPYIYFIRDFVPDPVRGIPCNFWEEGHGIAPGHQWPWALPTQRLVWQEDSYGNLAQAWEQYSPLIA